MDSSSTPFLPRSASSGDSHSTAIYGADDDDITSTTTLQEKHHLPSSFSSKGLLRKRPSVLNLTTYLLAIWGFFSLLFQTYTLLSPSSSPPPSQTILPAVPDPYHPSSLPPSLSPTCYCGSTPDEARQVYNCTYDTLSTAWLPPHCRDEALTAEFDVSGPAEYNHSWPYFADSEGKVPLTVEQVAALGGTQQKFWAYRRWHLVHCLFYWQKYWRIRETGKVMEERFDNLGHVRHCVRLILNPPPEKEFLIAVPVRMNSSEDVGGGEGEGMGMGMDHHHHVIKKSY